jgi:hypothetical protein
LTGGLDHAGDLHIVIWALAGFKLSGDEIDIDGLGEQFRREAAAFMTYASVAAEFRPDDTDASTGFSGREGPSTLLGIHPNSRYAVSDGEAPASWVDPELPWDLDEPESEALSLVFADGSAWERCDLMEVEDLTALRHLAWPLQPTEQDLAIRGLCEQLVEPFLRVGSGEDNYRSDAQPLCHSAGTEVFVYSGHADPQDITRDEALDAFCTGGLLDDGGFEQRSGWTVDRNADVVSGVGTLVPYNGAQMLTLYLAPNTGAAFGKAWQVLGDDLPEGRFEMSMMWRVWTRWSDCKSSGDPWAIARVDGGGEVGAVEIATQMVENTDWCDDLVTHPGGRYKNDWQELTIEFDGPVEGPVISFIMGSGTGVDDHHWLVDDVSLRRVQ